MNKKDKRNIARLLAGIATDDTINVVNAGKSLLKDHPEISEYFEESHRLWWEVEPQSNITDE